MAAAGRAGRRQWKTFIEQIINTFLAEAPSIEQLLVAACPHDRAGLTAAAHRLKGQVAYFGVAGLHAQLDALECRGPHARLFRLRAAAARRAATAGAALPAAASALEGVGPRRARLLFLLLLHPVLLLPFAL
ncbi:MAG: Hpt domain-containing protein [Hymenobacter sp.]